MGFGLVRALCTMPPEMDPDETRVALLYGRIILACLAVLIATWQLDVDIPLDPTLISP
jgi:hypothetical protein